MREQFLVAAAAALLLSGAACATPGTVTQSSTGEVAEDGSVGLVVQNQNYADMDVYVVADGLATRLGTVTGNSKGQFRLSPSFFPTNELRVVATPIGGNGRATTGLLNVAPGQQIDFTIAPVLRQSFGSVQ